MNTYSTGENIELLDQVKVGMFGMEFSGTVVYIQGIAISEGNYKWCEERNLKGIIVEWNDPDSVIKYLSINDETRNGIADFIQLSDWDSEDLVFTNRNTKNYR